MNTLTPEATHHEHSSKEGDLSNLDDPAEADPISEINDKGLQVHLIPDSTHVSPLHTFVTHDHPESLLKTILFSFLSSSNVAAILAIIFSITKFSLPVIVETYVFNFENLAFATSLFFTGVVLWYHPFKGCNYLEVIPCLIIKHFVVPALAGLFCWVLKFDKLNANACILLFSLPSDCAGIGLLSKIDIEPNPITFSFIFSQIIGLPCFMLLITLFNEAHLFN